MIGRPRACLCEQPLRPDHRFRKQVQMLIQRDRLQTLHLKIHFQMILQILAHALAVNNRADPMRLQ